MRISDWSSDVCSSDLHFRAAAIHEKQMFADVGDREQDAIAASGTDFFASGERAIDLERKRRSAAVRPAEGHEYGALAAVVDHLRRIDVAIRLEEHTSELQSLMRLSYAVFCLKKKNIQNT